MNIRFILYNIIHFLPLSNFIFPPAKHKKFTLPLRGCGIVICILRFFKGVLFSRAPAARENNTGSREGVRAMPKFSVKKPLTVFVAVVAVLVLGVVSYLKMTPDLLPNMDFPYIVIMTTYPGASPEKVEAEISKPLEQSMSTLEHIKEVTSTSSENYSVVMLEFEESVNMDTIGVDIQQKITALQGSWDDVVGSPYVLKINPDLLPVEVAAVAMDGKDTVALTEFLSDTLMPKLEGISGVARITASGTVEQQLHVVLDQQKIDRTNLKIANAINGKLDDAANELLEKRDELTDAQDQIDTARLQLDSGKASLSSSTASAEAELSQKQAELISAKSELQNQITQLQASKAQVETILTTLRAIRDALNSAAAQSNPLQEELNTLYALRDSAYSLQAREDAFYAQIQAVYDDPELSDEEKQAAVDALYAGEEYAAITADRATLDAELAVRGFGSIEDVNVRIAQLETEIADINAKVESFRQQLADLGIELNLLDSKIAELESQVSQIDETINYLQLDVLPQLDSGMLQLKDATRILSQQKTSGMLEISGAMADLAANAAGLDSALAQMDTGLDSIESSRQEALDKADLNGILSMEMISGILQAQSFYMPAGYVAQDGISYMVSVGEEITDLETLQNLLLFDLGIDGVEPVRLQDVAEVFLTDNRNETYARLNGQESIVLSFEKQSTYSTAGATANVNARFRQLEEQYPGLRFVALMDQGDYIHLIVDNILNSLLLGAVFAILILFLFLRDIRPTFITLCSIPISVIFAIVLMYFSGVTINMISLSGLAVAVGMLVDNSIVVIENIYRLRAKGVSAAKAAVAGAAQVAGAVTSSTLTTVCVFLPIVFIEGITRQLFTDLALTMSYSLLASLIVSLTLVPAMASGMMRRQKKEKKGRVSAGLLRGYEKIAGFALDHKALVLLIAVAALAATGYLALARGFTFMPEMDMPSLTLTIAMPEDSTMEEAAALSDQVLTRINAMDGIETAGAMMSTGTASLLGMGGSGGSHDVTVYITLADDTASGAQMGQRIIDECADLNCEITSSSAMMDMSMLTGSGISLELYGQDMDALQAAARTAAEALRGVDGVASVSDGLEDAAPALHIQIDRDMAMSQGLTIAQVYAQVAAALSNTQQASTLTLSGTSTDIVVERPEEARLDVEHLKAYTLEATDMNGEARTVKLSDVATVEETTSLTSISRKNQRRSLTVTAQISSGYNVTLVTADASRIVGTLDLGEGISYAFTGENESIMDAVEQLLLMLALGILLVYLVMVAQFQSLKSPFIVMFTIPLAFTGGFMALLICRMEVSVISLIGFVMLTGIIVNNGIVLVDYINQLRADGMERREAILEAGRTRIRPILMTSVTTILGLIDMALSKNAGSAMMQPMAVVCIGGLIYATLMTLLVVPCIYDIFSKKPPRVLSDQELQLEGAE